MFEQLLPLIAEDKGMVFDAIILISAIASFMFTLSKARLVTAKKDEIYSDLSRDFAIDVQKRNDVLYAQNQEFSKIVASISKEIAEIKVENKTFAGKLRKQEKVISLQTQTINIQTDKINAMQGEIERIRRQNLEYRAGINILLDQVTEAGIEPRYKPSTIERNV